MTTFKTPWRVTLLSHRDQDYFDYTEAAGWEHCLFVSCEIAQEMRAEELAKALRLLRATRPPVRTDDGWDEDEWSEHEWGERGWEYLGDDFYRADLQAYGRDFILVWNDLSPDYRVDFAKATGSIERRSLT